MKNYYQILGVLPTAESVVIKAAYKALAQRYHPDKNPDKSDEYKRKMQEINEAYEVLSNEDKRKEYDGIFFNSEADNLGGIHTNSDDIFDLELKNNWETVLKFYPDLVLISGELGEISSRLESAFKYHLIESKDFENRYFVAASIEKAYFEKYFGKDEAICHFAKVLILCKFFKAAQDLNQAVLLLGQNSNPNRIIETIRKELEIDEQKRLADLSTKIYAGTSISKLYRRSLFSRLEVGNEIFLDFHNGKFGYETEDTVRIHDSLESLEKSVRNYKKCGMFLVGGLAEVIAM